jgi:drug/metabolite transporter (DMT)-like permease
MARMRDEVQLASDIYRLEGATSTPVLVAAPPATKMVVILTRKLQTSDSSATMAYCSSLVYLAASLVLLPLPAMVGEMPNVHPSIAFVIRPWSMPPFPDWLIMSALGLIWTAWLYLLSRAYSLAEASVAAPFEYVSLPINMMWGFLIWHEIPTWSTSVGASLALGSGLYVLYRERVERPKGVELSNAPESGY